MRFYEGSNRNLYLKRCRLPFNLLLILLEKNIIHFTLISNLFEHIFN